MSRLGGVHMVPSGREVDALIAVASNLTLLRLTDAQVNRWHSFQQRLLAWNGSMQALDEIIEGPYE